MAVVRLRCASGCDKSTIKVQQKYVENKAHVHVGNSTVRKLFLAPTVQ